MKQLTILSGKGGTGKTSLTASLAVLAKNAVVADCDVDAPDLHMLLHPQILETQPFAGSKVATIDPAKCTKCGICKEKCTFDAITPDFVVDAIACEGCGVCAFVCPVDAATLGGRESGNAYLSQTPYGFMSHALLNPGEANSGKLVTLVRKNAKALSTKHNCDLIIIDGSPGIGCPVIASISGVDASLVVTEPTLSGIHDLQRVLKLLKHFNVTPFVCVNMNDVNPQNTQRILDVCKQNSIEVLGKIPFDPKVTQAMVNGKTIIEYAPNSDAAQQITSIWNKLQNLLPTK
ncbi:MAG: ATP-binding protein [Candidatus Bathyarchaeota archaeon]|nr:ATP-binding protein [Candidatus Bathyarchaeota archaeon]